MSDLLKETQKQIENKARFNELMQMSLGEIIPKPEYSILRVVDGWIYMFENSSTFVPQHLKRKNE